jgi:spore coat protein CotF
MQAHLATKSAVAMASRGAMAGATATAGATYPELMQLHTAILNNLCGTHGQISR